MKTRKIAGECNRDDCPAVHVSERGTLIFQGDLVHNAPAIKLGCGEQAVELPESVVREAVRALGW